MSPSPLSLTTRIGFGVQSAKDTFPTTGIQLARGGSADTMPEFDYIEHENHMLGIHERSTSQQSVAERSSVRVPVQYDIHLYPLTLPYLLFGIGFVPATGVTADGITTHKLVKSNAFDALYLTNYVRMGSGAQQFHRQIQNTRFSQLVITMNRADGVVARVTGMGLNETPVASGSYTVTNESDTQFLPHLGGLLWNTAVGSDYNFGLPREHIVTIDRPIEEDDQRIHEFYRNDNQEMSFAMSGQMNGLDFGLDVYNELFYGGSGSFVGAELAPSVVLTGLTFELNTARNIPAATAPYKWVVNIPKAELRATNFRAAGNELIRADVMWRMIDDALTPPVRMELTNAVASYGTFNQAFLDAGGTNWTLPDATP